MGFVKEQNIWVKKAERGTIDPDEVTLGGDEIHMEVDEHEWEVQETGAPTAASSFTDFDIRGALEAIFGRFDSLDTRFESITTQFNSIERKQDKIIAQVQQLQTHQY